MAQRPKTFAARLSVSRQEYFLGRWPTKLQAQIARDRAVLFFGVDYALMHPRKSRALGPASPEQLRWLATAELKRERTSAYFGVWWFAAQKRWRAAVTADGRTHDLGTYREARDAAIAHDRAARHLFGKNARLNFPGANDGKPASPASIRREAHAKFKASTSSRYRGVTRDPDGRWSANVAKGSQPKFCGRWLTEREAAVAYDRGALHYFRKRAVLNFESSRRLSPASAPELATEAFRASRKRKKRKSPYIGVAPVGHRWQAGVYGAAGQVYLGLFDTPEEAALVRDREAIKLIGSKVRLNFHPDTEEPVHGARLADLVRDRRRRGM